MSETPRPEGIVLTPEEKARRQRRSRAHRAFGRGLVVLFYVITIFKMGPAILARPM